MKILVKYDENTPEEYKLKVNPKGDWIDLRASENILLGKPFLSGDPIPFAIEYKAIPLGVRIKLPSGYEAIMAPRSSTFKNFGLMMQNSIGIIDNTYSGNNDVWHFPGINLSNKNTSIKKGDRICQFRVQLSQRATSEEKKKWLEDSTIEIIEVDNLDENNRGGLGSTGIK